MTHASVDEDPKYDTFISFSSADRRVACWLQQFLETWVDQRSGRRLRAFLDETDLRGGRLDKEIRSAAHSARTLIICYSPMAAESKWVQAEVGLFREKAEPDRIAVALVGGVLTVDEVGRCAIPGVEVRVHDLRRGRWMAKFGLGAKVELLRLLAFVADVDLRTLRDWYLRRTLRNVAMFVILALAPLLILGNLPLTDWEHLALKDGSKPLYAIAAEAESGKLMAASRFRGAGPQGFRDYISVTRDALGDSPTSQFEDIALRRRALPLSRLPFAMRDDVPKIDPSPLTSRGMNEAWLCQVSPGRMLVVLPLRPTEDELSQAGDLAADFGTPIPEAVGAIVVTIENGTRIMSLIPDLSPFWRDVEPNVGRTSPAHGLAVAWSPEGEVWLGMQGRDAVDTGGLWRRRPGSTEWENVPGFRSVQSVDLAVSEGRTAAVWVAERHLDVWHGFVLEPSQTRVVMLEAGQSQWRSAPAPPYGTRSDVELAGWLGRDRIVRVDEKIFRQRSIPLWRFLLNL